MSNVRAELRQRSYDLEARAAWAIGLLVGIQLIWWGTDALVAASVLRRMLDGTTAH